ncbi:pantoate--beta-alanine ligase [Schaalia vaccimaxillae]|uniref:pantoate--beta-alanine ligase n=1 Tax=Schaalia vaccimaxillae TaxID=183916 RepID=UPI0003B7B6CA|nr:pantoate--beta-alanine ligase [Schaalia vaccimaxillae]
MSERPVLTRTRSELASALDALQGSRALVMTMGALHEGHLQLVREAKTLADHVVVTIFVNPTQFAPGEDFDAYPRTLDADMEALASVGADLVWAPEPDQVYPEPVRVSIDPGPIARVLEGKTRPTHFAGVALVCTKVIGLVRPDVALYGQKDAQQLAMLRTVFNQLDLPVTVHPVAIVRDEDGVALSSRNQYLSEDERVRARALSRGLQAAVALADEGASADELVVRVMKEIDDEGGIVLDYVAVVDDGTFDVLAASAGTELADEDALAHATPVADATARAGRILVAAKVGTTRLIDNMGVALRAAGDQGGNEQ